MEDHNVNGNVIGRNVEKGMSPDIVVAEEAKPTSHDFYPDLSLTARKNDLKEEKVAEVANIHTTDKATVNSKLHSQREIVELRLRKKGVKIISEEEAKRILEQARSDLVRLEKPEVDLEKTHEQESKKVTEKKMPSDRKTRKKKSSNSNVESIPDISEQIDAVNTNPKEIQDSPKHGFLADTYLHNGDDVALSKEKLKPSTELPPTRDHREEGKKILLDNRPNNNAKNIINAVNSMSNDKGTRKSSHPNNISVVFPNSSSPPTTPPKRQGSASSRRNSNSLKSSKKPSKLANKHSTGHSSIIDEITAVLELTKGTAESKMEISRPSSTVSKPSTQESSRRKYKYKTDLYPDARTISMNAPIVIIADRPL